jgi:hypothetical protein
MKKKIPKLLFLDFKKEIIKPTFGAWSLLLVHGRFTPSEGPKVLQKSIFQKLDHGSVTMEKGHLAWDNFVVHDVNNPLVLLCDYHSTMLECGYSVLLCYLPFVTVWLSHN